MTLFPQRFPRAAWVQDSFVLFLYSFLVVIVPPLPVIISGCMEFYKEDMTYF